MKLPRACIGLARMVAVAALYWGVSWVSLSCALVRPTISPIWLSSGVAVAMLFLWGLRLWPGVWAGAFISAVASGLPWVPSALVALSSAAEAWVVVAILRGYTDFTGSFERPRDQFNFSWAAALAAAIPSICGPLILSSAGAVPTRELSNAILTWWAGNWTGLIVMTPAILAWRQPAHWAWTPWRLLEGLALLLCLGVLSWGVFGPGLPGFPPGAPLEFVLAPFFAWASLRFEVRGASCCTLLVTAWALWATTLGRGPFALYGHDASIWLLQVLLVVMAVTAHVMATASARRRQVQERLQEDEARLALLARMARSVHGSLSIEQIVVAAAHLLHESFPKLQAFYADYDPSGKLVVRSSAGPAGLPSLLGRMRPVSPEGEYLRRLRCFEVIVTGAEGLPGQPPSTAAASLHAPIHRTGELVGILGLESLEDHSWTEAERRTLPELANYLSFVLGDARAREERWRAEEALRRSEQKHRMLLEQAADGIFLASVDGVCLDMNDSCSRMLGKDRAATVGREIAEHVAEEQRPAVTAALAGLRAGSTVRGEWRLLRADGAEFPAEVSAKLLPDGRVQGIVRDVSERHRAEEARAKLEAQLRHSQKLQAVGSLAGGIAHDFNNILTGIVSNAELLRSDTGPDCKESAEAILAASLRAQDLVRQLLTFSRRSESPRGPLRMELAVREALGLVRASLPSNITLIQELDTACPQVIADSGLLQQLTVNLCANAAAAMRQEGGVLRLRVEPVEHTAPQVTRTGILAAGRWVRLTVSDSGKGMAPEVLEHLFEPFFTTKPTGQAGGLGLAVVHGIVEQHGGAIQVESEDGLGSVFHIYFPVALGGEVVESAAPRRLPSGSGQIIWWVDDEVTVATAGERVLRRLGYTVRVFSQPQESLEALRAPGAKPDLLILDFMMPGLSGDRLAEEALRERPGVPILLVSGYQSEYDEGMLRRLGVRGFLAKPFTLSQLGEAVAAALPAAVPTA